MFNNMPIELMIIVLIFIGVPALVWGYMIFRFIRELVLEYFNFSERKDH